MVRRDSVNDRIEPKLLINCEDIKLEEDEIRL